MGLALALEKGLELLRKPLPIGKILSLEKVVFFLLFFLQPDVFSSALAFPFWRGRRLGSLFQSFSHNNPKGCPLSGCTAKLL